MKINKYIQIITPHKKYVASFSEERNLPIPQSLRNEDIKSYNEQHGTKFGQSYQAYRFEDVIAFALCEITYDDGQIAEGIVAIGLNEVGDINPVDLDPDFLTIEEDKP